MLETIRSPRYIATGAIASIALIVSGCGGNTEAAPEPSSSTAVSSPANPAATPKLHPIGYDVSWAQCDKPLPADGAFAIIQITGGRADLMSPCFKEQVEWADTKLTGTPTQPKAEYYIWPANPGKNYRGQPIASWPTQGSNKYGDCEGSNGQPCSYEYGLMRGRQAMKFAIEQLGSQALGRVYIDVESGVGDEPGTWQTDSSHNLAAIEGYVAAISETGNKPGIYSNMQHLRTVLNQGDANTLVDLPEWTTGSGTVEDAKSACALPFIKDAKVVLSQYRIAESSGTTSDFDLNFSCEV